MDVLVSESIDSLGATPLLIAYYAVTGLPIGITIGYTVAVSVLTAAYVFFAHKLPELLNVSGENWAPFRAWSILYLEICLFFVFCQGSEGRDVQADGFRSSFLYIPMGIAWHMVAVKKMHLKGSARVEKMMATLRLIAFLIMAIYGATTPPKGYTHTMEEGWRWPVLILLPIAYICMGFDGNQDNARNIKVGARMSGLWAAIIYMAVHESLRKSNDLSKGPVDYHVFRDILADPGMASIGVVPVLIRGSILLSSARQSNIFFTKGFSKARFVPTALCTAVIISCVVANCNAHALLWGLLTHWGVLLTFYI